MVYGKAIALFTVKGGKVSQVIKFEKNNTILHIYKDKIFAVQVGIETILQFSCDSLEEKEQFCKALRQIPIIRVNALSN